MKAAIMLVAVLFIPALAFSDTIYVPDHYAKIQEAIDAAVNGDIVVVKPGTYVENIDFKGKAITVKSEQGPEVTVIDGNQSGSVVTFMTGEGLDSVLDGFSITKGSGTFYTGFDMCGGGIYCEGSSPLIKNNTIHDNLVSGGGGGILIIDGSSPEVINNDIYENVSNNLGGGGIAIAFNSHPTIRENTIRDNSTPSHGGGIGWTESSPTVTSNDIHGNSAKYGGGIGFADDVGGLIANNVIRNNSVTHTGGGIGSFNSELVEIVNNTIIGNSADVLGGGLVGAMVSTTITNSIIWGNTPDQVYGLATVSYCNVQFGYPGTGNIASDPLFVDPAIHDYHLTHPSPCQNTGDNTAATILHDFEGDPRICQGTVDIGADECYRHLYVTGDKTPGGVIHGKMIGSPGTYPVGLFIGSGVLTSPVNTMWGEYWLQAPWILFPLLETSPGMPLDGILVLTTTLPPSIPAPYDVPMQALIGLNADSLTNLYVLKVR